MSVEIEPVEVYGWEGLRIHDQQTELVVIPGPGGRLISLRFDGQELLYHQEKHAGETFVLDDGVNLREEKKRLGFRLWGGDKTWIAPQSDWWEGIPPLQLDAGTYAAGIEDNAVMLLSRPCAETGLRVVRRFELEGSGRIHFREEIQNTSTSDVERGIWNVTQVLRPGRVFIPGQIDDVITIEHEGDSGELRDRVVSQVGSYVSVTCEELGHFKYGIKPVAGEVFTFVKHANQNYCHYRRFEMDFAATYAHGAALEVYNSPSENYFEVEVHAPLSMLAADQRQSHDQLWIVGRVSKADPEIARAELRI